MQLTFEYERTIGVGGSPQALHMMDNSFRIIYLEAGVVKALSADPVLGLYQDLEFKELGQYSPDIGVTHPSLKKVAHHGAYGFWSCDRDHRFVIYMLPTDISKTFEDATINMSVGNEVTTFSGSFLNLRDELFNRNRSLLIPNSKLELYFTLGSSKEISLGQFYVDGVSCKYTENEISVSARNTIGKRLKEQFFDENNVFEEGSLQDNLSKIMHQAEIEDFFVSDSTKGWQLKFEPDMSLLDGILQIIKLLSKWKIEEKPDGTIGIGPPDDIRFDQPQTVEFERDHSCWEYDMEYDDADSYSRICVFCNEPEERVYVTVPRNKWWVLPSNKTKYVQVADGTSKEEIQVIAEELSEMIAISGRIETFVGIFSPQLIIGDEIELLADGEKKIIGTVTSIKHALGRAGFYTEFAVDSGGRKGKTRLSDLIGEVSGTSKSNGVTIY